MWPPLIALSGIAWLASGPALAWWMGRRGFDPGSWLVLGLVVGPLAVLLALMDTAWWTPPPPVVVRRAQSGSGALDALVVVNHDEESREQARMAIERLGAGLRRLAVVCVLPAGGPRLGQVDAAAQLRRDAEQLGRPTTGVAILFGRPDDAVRRFGIAEGYDVVVHPVGHAAFNSTLQQAGLRGVTYRDSERLALTPPDLAAIA